MNRLSQIGCLVTLLWMTSSAQVLGDQRADSEFFEQYVRPLIVEKCLRCHGGEKSGGGLSLDSAEGWQKGGNTGPAIIPGNSHESLLIDAINYRSLEMPPRDHGGQLSKREIEILTDWVNRGAPDPRRGEDKIAGMSRDEAVDWWSFQPLRKLTNSQVSEADLGDDD